jgi:hypothetical protein
MSSADLTITYIERLVASEVTVTEGMEALINYCESKYSSSLWQDVRHLPFGRDVSDLKMWLESVLSSEPPSVEIEAYWFGLFNPVRHDLESCDLYVAGSDHFDPDAQSADWAAIPVYFPEGRYAEPEILHALHRIMASADDEAGEFGDYTLCLGYACLAVATLFAVVDPAIMLGPTVSRAVAVGFDSGDFVLLGSVHQHGFHHLNQDRA